MASYAQPSSKDTISLLQYKPFEKLGNSNKFYRTILAKEAFADHITFPHSPSSDPPSQDPLAEIAGLLEEFADVVTEELPIELLPFETYNKLLT